MPHFDHFESLSLSKVAGTKIGRPVVRKSLDQVRRTLWKTCPTAATPVTFHEVQLVPSKCRVFMAFS